MAVQAHYHHHHHHRESPAFLASRGGGGGAPEGSRMSAAMELQQGQKEAMAPPLFLDFAHGDCGAGRKRQREAEAAAAAAAAPSMSPHLFSLQPQTQAPAPKAERLQRALADTRRRQYRSLLVAAEATASQRIREKEAEASEAARRGAELEDRVARLRAEAAAWQAKALADQSTAAALHAQLQQAAAAAAAAAQARGKAEEDDDDNAGAADDAGSCFVDPDRVEEIAPPPARPCRTCRRAPASVVLLPCRHLCVCADCEPAVPATAAAPFAGAGAVAAACPMCRGAVTGTVQVFFS